MADDRLTAGQRWALLSLMALDGEASNSQLKEAVGFTLTGAPREALESSGLITSVKIGRYRECHHTLTEEGWAWCDAELSAHWPDDSKPAGRALYAILHLWRRYLDNANVTLLELSQVAAAKPEPEPVDLADQIQLIYRKLAERPGDWVSLTRLRAELPPVKRADLDHRLRELNRTSRVFIVPEANQKVLTAADRRAAIRIGGEESHLIAIEDA
jgi:hypothetical protein